MSAFCAPVCDRFKKYIRSVVERVTVVCIHEGNAALCWSMTMLEGKMEGLEMSIVPKLCQKEELLEQLSDQQHWWSRLWRSRGSCPATLYRSKVKKSKIVTHSFCSLNTALRFKPIAKSKNAGSIELITSGAIYGDRRR